MKKLLLILFAFTSIGQFSYGQTGISSTGAAPDASAMLDVISTTSGFLTPRMTVAQKSAISTPATGLLIYQTDGTAGFYYYNGTTWVLIAASTGSGFIENRTVDNNFASGQSASFDITGNAEISGTLEVNGNIGVGTTTTNNRMQFDSDNSSEAMQWNTSAYVGANTWGTRIFKSDIGGGIPLKFQTQSSSTWYEGVDLDHGQDNTHPSLKTYYNTQLAVTSGNVGIGVTGPTEKLSVAGNIFMTGTRSEIYGTDRNHMIVFRGDQAGAVANETSYYQYGGTLAAGLGHRFFTGGVAASQTEKMRIADDGVYVSGNLGIGTLPGARLDVNGGAYLGYETTITNFGDLHKSGFYQNGGTAATGEPNDPAHIWKHLLTIRHSNTGNNHQLQISGSYAENDRLFFRKIAATPASNPSWNEFATRGTNTFTGNQTITGNLTVSGTISSSNVPTGSGAANRVTYWSGANTLTSNSEFTYGTTGNLSIFNAEASTGEVRLGAAWDRPGVYSSTGLNLFTASGQPIILGNNNTEYARLASNGNFGIGTTNPTGKLHVAGSHANGVMTDANDRPSIAATGNYPQLVLMGGVANGSHGATLMIGGYDSGNSGNHKHWSIGTAGNGATFLDIGYHAGTDLNPHAGIRNYNGSTFMTILNSGNVGIGTTAPVDKLDIRDAMSVNEIKFRNVGGGDDSDPYRLRKVRSSANVNELRLDLNDDVNELFTIYGNSCSGYGCAEYSGNLYHWFRSDGYAYHAGRLGVGNQSPNARVDISDNGGSDGIAMGQIHGDNTNTIQTYIDGQWANRASYAGGCCNKLLLQPDVGEVGIGITNPGSKLDVGGDIRSTGNHIINNGAPTIYFQDNNERSGMIHMNSNLMYFLSGSGTNSLGWTTNGSYWPLYINMTNDDFVFGGAAYFMEGRVGINTSGPGAAFHVNGNTGPTHAIIGAGGSYYTDWPGGWGGGLASWDLCIASMRYSGLSSRSDIRLKKDVKDLDKEMNAVETLSKLRPVTYHWIDERLPKNLRYGFIAQEVEKVLPELVEVGTDSLQTLGVNYIDIIPMLTQAIQEQQKEIESLKTGASGNSENEELKKEIAELRKMIQELKSDQNKK